MYSLYGVTNFKYFYILSDKILSYLCGIPPRKKKDRKRLSGLILSGSSSLATKSFSPPRCDINYVLYTCVFYIGIRSSEDYFLSTFLLPKGLFY